MNKKYILQTEKGYSGCFLISLLNARIYYEDPIITSLDDPKWEYFVDKYFCRYGACLNRDEAIRELRFKKIKVKIDDIKEKFPVVISSFTKVGFHSSLIIGKKEDTFQIVNYDGRCGELISYIKKNDIVFLPENNINNNNYYLIYER